MHWERVKAHIRKNKVKYAFGAGVIVTGIIFIVTRRIVIQSGQSNTASFFIGKNLQNNFMVSVLEREGRGHPGYMVERVEDKLRYITQGDAAESMGVSDKIMSMHIRGVGEENINGFHFHRIGVNTA